MAKIKTCDGCGRPMPELVVPALLPDFCVNPNRVLWIVRTCEGEKVICNNKREALSFLSEEMRSYIKERKLIDEYKRKNP